MVIEKTVSLPYQGLQNERPLSEKNIGKVDVVLGESDARGPRFDSPARISARTIGISARRSRVRSQFNLVRELVNHFHFGFLS